MYEVKVYHNNRETAFLGSLSSIVAAKEAAKMAARGICGVVTAKDVYIVIRNSQGYTPVAYKPVGAYRYYDCGK